MFVVRSPLTNRRFAADRSACFPLRGRGCETCPWTNSDPPSPHHPSVIFRPRRGGEGQFRCCREASPRTEALKGGPLVERLTQSANPHESRSSTRFGKRACRFLNSSPILSSFETFRFLGLHELAGESSWARRPVGSKLPTSRGYLLWCSKLFAKKTSM